MFVLYKILRDDTETKSVGLKSIRVKQDDHTKRPTMTKNPISSKPKRKKDKTRDMTVISQLITCHIPTKRNYLSTMKCVKRVFYETQ